MPTSLIAPIVGGAASAGFGSLFGSGSKSGAGSFSPTGISAGGLSTNFSDATGNIGVNASPERLAAVGGIANTFGNQADFLGGLAQRVAPGVSELRKAQLAQIENARTSSLSNLKDNLARRRVLGSSFGQDAVSRSEAEFGQAKAQTEAQSFLQELDLTNQLTNQQFNAARSQIQTGLDEMNLEANVAMGLSGKASDALSSSSRLLMGLNAQEAQLRGQFFGNAFKPAFNAIGQGAANLFKSAGTFGASPVVDYSNFTGVG